jgi:hypothetical protein
VTQYLTAKFSADEKRAYTYHNDGDPVAPGDRVLVPGRGDKPRTVIVDQIGVPKPEGFDTKAILGLAPPRAEEEGKLL